MKKLTLILLFASGLALSAQAQTPAPAALPEVDHWVYLSELPDPAELSQNAATNGLTVQRIDRTADAVIITCKYPDGVVGSMGYKLLSAVRSSDRIAGGSASLRTVSSVPTVVETRTVIEREPEIIYVDRTPRTRVVYRERDDFWLPLTLGLGIGYITGHNSHGHHWRGHYGGHYRSYRSHHSYHRGHRGHGRR